MIDVAIIASPRDREYSAAIGTILKRLGAPIAISEKLPAQQVSRVILVWSAALQEIQSIDGQALIGLWSEGRLTTVRLDATPLPLGMRDLPSLPPGTAAREVVDSLAPPKSSKPDDASFTGRESAGPKPRSRALVLSVLGALLVVAAGGYWYLTAEQRSRQAELAARLETAAKANQELNEAREAEAEAQHKLAEARAAELEAIKRGDREAASRLGEERKRAEAEGARQAELVRQREAAAEDARSNARKAAEGAKAAAVRKSAPEAKVAAAAPKAEAPKAEVAKAEVAKAEVAKSEPSLPEAPRPTAKTRAEREREEEDRLAREAAAKSVQVAASPSVTAPASAAPEPSPEEIFREAQALEASGDARQAVRLYRRAARAGHGKSALRLGEIYDRGIPGVPRDYAESLSWYQRARELGQEIPGFASRTAAPPAAAPQPVEKQAKAAAPPPAAARAPAAEEGPEWPKIAVALAVLALAAYAWRRSRRPAPQQAAPASPAAAPAAADGAILFVSYSHKDKARIEPIVSMIEQTGRQVWMDRTGITGQAGWAGQIVRAIRQSRAVVLMASPNSYASDQVVRELYLAMNHKKPIVPIEIEPAELPDELQYILAPYQHHRLSAGAPREVLGRALAAV